MKKGTKIFCIGLNKMGTSSLHYAFEMLGFKSVHFVCDKGRNIKKIIRDNNEDGKMLLTSIEEYDAYSDWNFPSTNNLFKVFDKQYPESKFILNTRDMESWVKSRENHILSNPNLEQLRKESPENTWYSIDKVSWRKEYESHHKDVQDYFKGKSNSLLVFDVTKGDGWEKLCPFLEVPILNQSFPHYNKAQDSSFLSKLKRKIFGK